MGNIQKTTNDLNDGYLEKIASQIAEVNEPNLKCKLCNSKFRADAEKMYDEIGWGALTRIHKMLLENGENISKGAVHAHLKNHFEKQKSDLAVKEYVEDTVKYRLEKISKRQALEDRRAILNKTLLTLAAQLDGSYPEEQRKNAIIVKQLSDGINAIEAQLDLMEQRLEPVVMMMGLIKQCIKSKMEETDSQEVKNALYELMGEMSEKLKGVMAEVKE